MKKAVTGLQGSRWAPRPASRSRATSATSTATAQPPQRGTSPAPGAAASTSQKAPITTAITPAVPHSTTTRGAFTPAQQLDRYTKLIGRLNWKIPSLDHGYFQAITATARLANGESTATEAEYQVMMFKLDFYEFYMLIERALVHLLLVFGVVVTGGGISGTSGTSGTNSVPPPPNGSPNNNVNGTAGGVGAGGDSFHAYHHNVLIALNDNGNPLHKALGIDPVRFELQRAKELRNRWKYIEERGNIGAGGSDEASKPLEQLELRRMLETISQGFVHAHAIAMERVGEWTRSEEGQAGSGGDDGESTWDFMVDAMDWESV